MKRQFWLYIVPVIVVIVVILVLLFTGSIEETPDTWKPITASDDVAPYASRAIEIIDEYLNFEKDWTETKDAFSDLYYRIDPLNITGDSKYNEADQEIDSIISSLFPSKKTDSEYHLYRDTLAFYIGAPVSGKAYEAERDVYNYIFNAGGNLVEDTAAKEKLSKFIDINAVPFNRGSVDEHNNGAWSISLYFDQKNGVSVSSLQKYITDVCRQFDTMGLTNAFVFVDYDRFEQSVFSIFLHVADGDVYGSVSRNDAPYEEALEEFENKYSEEERDKMDKYPKEFDILNPLYEFDSIEDLPKALKVASDFAGVK